MTGPTSLRSLRRSRMCNLRLPLRAPGFELQQVIDDEDMDLVIKASELAGLLQELVVGEAGYGGGDVGVQRGSRQDINII